MTVLFYKFPGLVNAKKKVGRHFSGVVFQTFCQLARKKFVNGLKPEIHPDAKVIFGNCMLVILIDFDMCQCRISAETAGKEKVTFPKVGELIEVLIPVMDSIIEKVTYFLIFSNLAVKTYHKFFYIGSILDFSLHF